MSIPKLFCSPSSILSQIEPQQARWNVMQPTTYLLLTLSIGVVGCSAVVDSTTTSEYASPGLTVRHQGQVGGPFQKRGRTDHEADVLEAHYYYYDGEVRREVWMDPTRLIELLPDEAGSSTVQHFYSGAAEPIATTRFHRVWQLEGARSDDAAGFLTSTQPNGHFTPLFQHAPSGTGSRLGLPGGIIVVLDPGWSAQQVADWLASEKLERVRDLPLAPNALLIASDPGLPGLERANALFESGTVRRAQPNWWREMAVR